MTDRHTYRYVTDWQRLDPKDGEAIRAFWTREQANVEGEEATRRLSQVVAHVLDKNDEIAAVATAASKILPRLGQPMYYFRCFVGRAWRGNKLSRSILRHTQSVLGPYARERGFPCIGILLELENEHFARTMRRAYWSDTGFSYIGQSARGQDLRVCYFIGARLKTSEQIAQLARDIIA